MAFSSPSDSFYPPNWHQPQPSVIGNSSGAGSTRPGSMLDRARMAQLPLPEAGLKCPRCDSTNTKFCYFNNYNLSQPRHLCKACRRYWTRGGSLRNVPVGGGSRKGRAKTSQRSVSVNANRFVSVTLPNLPYLSGFVEQQSSNLLTGSGLQANGLYPLSRGLNLSKSTVMGNTEEHQYSNWGSGNVWTNVSAEDPIFTGSTN